jgi:hypothetical protein
VCDRVVQLAGDPHALGGPRGERLLLAGVLHARRLLAQLARQQAAAAQRAPGDPGDHPGAEDRGRHAVGMEHRRVRGETGHERRQAGHRGAAPGVRSDRVGGGDQGEAVEDRERVEAQREALEAHGGEHRQRDRDRRAPAPQQRGHDEHGACGGERAIAGRRRQGELDLGAGEQRRGEREVLVVLAARGAPGGRGRSGRRRAAGLGGRRLQRSGRRRGRRERGCGGPMAQDAEDAPHVGEGLAGAAGDAGEQRARRRPVLRGQPPRELLGVAEDRGEAPGDDRLQVAGDAHPLLVGGPEGVALALALELLRLALELVPQQGLAAEPAADQQWDRGVGERQDDVAGAFDRRVEGDPHRGERHGRGRRDGEARDAGDVAAHGVEREHERHERRHRRLGDEPAQQRLGQQPGRDGRQRQQRGAAAPRERQRGEREHDCGREPAALGGGGEQDLGLAGDRQAGREQRVEVRRPPDPRDDAGEVAHLRQRSSRPAAASSVAVMRRPRPRG